MIRRGVCKAIRSYPFFDTVGGEFNGISYMENTKNSIIIMNDVVMKYNFIISKIGPILIGLNTNVN
jgi:hypothetical protein